MCSSDLSACGTTIVTFDPPLVFNVSKSCGAVRDEAPDMSCDMPAGHEGQHAHLVEKLVRWPTDEMIEAYAAEAEAGYDPEQLRPRHGGLGDGYCEPIRLVARQAGKTAEMLALVETWRKRGYVIEERVGAWLAWHPDSVRARSLRDDG